jgi:SAM-dependent methyltransferase
MSSPNPVDEPTTDPSALRAAVRDRYAAVARKVSQDHRRAGLALPVLEEAGCCGNAGSSCGTAGDKDVISANLYAADEVAELPAAAVMASLGCGNPTALAALRPGEVVLDLGSGGGIDVLLSARRVGPNGFAYGLDMTDDMLALAEHNAAERGVTNAKFLKGQIEAIPLPDASVDVIVSNCVINLSVDKRRVLQEAFRVLRPGGRLAVSDIVVRGHLPSEIRRDMQRWAGCMAGALEEDRFRQLLAEAGFEGIGVEVTRIYQADELAASTCCPTDASTGSSFSEMEAAGGQLVSAFVRATRPRGGVTADPASNHRRAPDHTDSAPPRVAR